MKTDFLHTLILFGVIILTVICFTPKATKQPPQVFTAEQAATIMKEMEWMGDGGPMSKEEKEYEQAILEKYYNSAPEIMALFPTLKEASDHSKSSLLYVLFYKKDGRKDILKFLEKTLSQDIGVLNADSWVGYALDYLEQWDVPSALRVAPRLLKLKYEPYKGRSSTGAARPTAIDILEKHGGQKELEPLTQFMVQREKEFGDQDILYRYARRAVSEIKSRLAKENQNPSQ
ncbi:MAG: hypothetical protein LBV12_02615 [Puniceicoccales bacterium]|jgi:hypothetical protein|nr:hypothetical protein [Puniceicoccales bacterium]